MNFSDEFYKNPDIETLIKYESDIDWMRLSSSIERTFTLNEFKLFYKKIIIPVYIHSHYINTEVFKFLDDNDLISFGDRYSIINNANRLIDDDNVKMFCGEYPTLWAVAFEKNRISEETLIENFHTITCRKTAIELIKSHILEREQEEEYSRFLLLAELNES